MNQELKTVEDAWLEYQRRLFLFIRSKVDTLEDAEDILSDVFERLANMADKKSIPDNISSWLYQVTKNRVVDYYRAKKTWEPLPDDLSGYGDEVNMNKQLSNCLLPMIHALPEKYQQVLMLSEIEGRKYKEVAIELDITLSAVKSRILRGREKLQKSMVACCTFHRNSVGEMIDYEQKMAGFCVACDE